MHHYTRFIARKALEYGDRWDASDLAPQFKDHLHSDRRIKVRTTYASGETHDRTGTVGVTSGWKPAFLLMRRSSAHGSSDVLSHQDTIIGVWNGRRYAAP